MKKVCFSSFYPLSVTAMQVKNLKNAVDIAHALMDQVLGENAVVVDMTCGNGLDSLYVLEKNPSAFLYGFDIQKSAIIRTKERLANVLPQRYRLIHDSHDHFDQYVKEPINLAFYNLGYLPKGDKSVTTTLSTTKDSFVKMCHQLDHFGAVIMTFYPGHPSGLNEYIGMKEHMQSLDQHCFKVLEFSFLNQKNNPPITVYIERIAK